MSESPSPNPLQLPHERITTCRGGADASIFRIIDSEFPVLGEATQILSEPMVESENMQKSSTQPAAIDVLLPEILSIIFNLVVDDTQADYARHPLWAVTPKVAVSCISYVNRRWRQIALDTPRLWSQLAINPNQEPGILALWLVRSAKLPLDVAIQYSPETHIRHLDLVFGTLSPHMYRLRSLRLELGEVLCAHALETCAKLQSLPGELQCLTLHNPEGSWGGLVTSLSRTRKEGFNQFLSPITALHLHSTTLFDWSLSAFQGLDSLTIDFTKCADKQPPSYRELMNMLHASPNLRSLKLAFLNVDNLPPREAAQLELRRLESLCLRSIPRDLFARLLHMIVPRPEGMVVYVPGYSGDRSKHIGLDFEFAIPDRVKALCLYDLRQRRLDLAALLTALPGLTTLLLSGVTLEICNPSTVQRRNLQTLELVNCAVSPDMELVRLLENRSISQLRIFQPKSGPDAATLREKVPGAQVSESRRGTLDDLYPSPYSQ